MMGFWDGSSVRQTVCELHELYWQNISDASF